MTKGICDLRKILHKAQVRLTEAGSLMYRGLCIIYISLCVSTTLVDFYCAKTPITGSERDYFVRIDSSTFMSNTYTINLA